jgi:LysM repeat protein
MDEKSTPASDSELEQRLKRLYHSPVPDPGYTRRLEKQLDKRISQLASNPPPTRPASWRAALGDLARWGWGLVGIALLVAVIVFAFSLLPGRPSALPQVAPTQTIDPTLTPGSPSTPTISLAETPTPAQPAPQVSLPIPGVITYTVAVGDSCASIAFNFGVSVEALVQANNLSPSCDTLQADQVLIIPVSGIEPTPQSEQGYVLPRLEAVNLRQGPGTSYDVVGTLSPGEKLLKMGDVTADGWLPVEYPQGSGEIAYVWVELVIVMDPSDAETGVPAPADWVRASNPRTLDDRLLVDVCFNLPDDGDWMIRDAILRIDQSGGSRELPYDSSTLISYQPFTTDSQGTHPGERCDVLEFPLEAGMVPENPLLSILTLEAYPREGQDCMLYMDRVQPLLTSQDTGILIACEQVPHASGNVTVVSKPDDMSLEAAQAVVYQAFQDTITLRGPWEFNLTQMLTPGGAMPDQEEQYPLLAELRALNLLRAQNFFQGHAWVHLHYRAIHQQSGGTLPDGRQIPPEYRMDEWYELDEKGRITRTVARMLTLSGEPIQVSVLQDGEFANDTFNETNPQEVFYLQPLDFGFTDLAENALKTGKSFTRQPLYFEGNYVGDQYVIRDNEVRRESLYDPATGKQLNFITWLVISEGLQLVSSMVVETLENVASPPAEILTLLAAPFSP